MTSRYTIGSGATLYEQVFARAVPEDVYELAVEIEKHMFQGSLDTNQSTMVRECMCRAILVERER
ncbi:hypothetical protein FHW16_005417 [Phyllobacterium myrsinacearum]|uniref:Uncharacterized protein n=1 Tax=Phyllobacterium myrsinacearum TaxID=28101 RepID=A0A839ES90_9HYPH|nr:hypothetical protein [Phyllobacterium myrsinacearum]